MLDFNPFDIGMHGNVDGIDFLPALRAPRQGAAWHTGLSQPYQGS